MIDTGVTKKDADGLDYIVFEPSTEWYIKMLSSTELPSFGKYEINASEAPSIWA